MLRGFVCSSLLVILCFLKPTNSNKPNILILYIENIHHVIDTVNNHPGIMPNFKELTNKSIFFTNMYGEHGSASNFASLFTGKPAVDLGMIQGKLLPFDYFPSLASTGGLSTEEVTIAKHLKHYGYVTWFTGFWQLGLGKKGVDFPTRHGFDTWMGIAHPHNEWCHRNKKGILSSDHSTTHPYITLLYKTSFIWMLVLLLLTTVVWFRIISVKLYVNLLIYTICASVAFYILLQLFIIQRSASCVLFYHEEPFQQPYEMKNLTLHLTRHMSRLIQISSDANKPFFAVLNYLKMKEPVFHSDIFRTKATNSFSSSLLELDWSIGFIVHRLHELNIFNNTVIFVTGSSNCNRQHIGELSNEIKSSIFQLDNNGNYVALLDYDKTMWNECLKVPLFIKELPDISSKYFVDNIVLTSNIFETVFEMSMYTSKTSEIKTRGLQKYYKSSDDSLENHMFSIISKADDPNNTMYQDTYNSSISWLNKSSNESDELKWVIEAIDEDIVLEALVSKEILNEEKVLNKPVEAIFHYHNIFKPVMVTYQEKYHVIYSYIDGDGYLQSLSSPVIVDIYNKLKPVNRTLLSKTLTDIYENVTALLKLHTIDRQNKNPWSSQFEMPVYPWLLPCSNFPICKTQRSQNDDFSDILTFEEISKDISK